MNNFSRGLLAATLTGSLVFAGTTVASAEEAATTTNCGSPKAEFTVKIDGKEHTFKKVSEFAWQATDNAELTLSRFEVFQMAKEGAAVCESESIDLGDWDASQGGPGKVDYDIVEGERQEPAPVEDENKDKDKNEQDKDNKEKDKGEQDKDKDNKDKETEPSKDKKSSVKDELSSEDNKPTPLGIAAIVAGVLAVIAAAFPFVKNALKL